MNMRAGSFCLGIESVNAFNAATSIGLRRRLSVGFFARCVLARFLPFLMMQNYAPGSGKATHYSSFEGRHAVLECADASRASENLHFRSDQ
jgi:hypothetical protein